MQLNQLDARVRKIRSDIRGLRVRRRELITDILAAPRSCQTFKPFQNGGAWGVSASENWVDFKFTARVPDDFRGKVALSARTGREGQWEATHPQILVWVNGRIEQAFDTQHSECTLCSPAVPGAQYEIFLQAYAATGEGAEAGAAPHLKLELIDVMDDVQQLYYDIDVPYEAAILAPDGSRVRERTLRALNDAIDLLDLRKPFSPGFHASVAAARDWLKTNYYAPLEAVCPEAVADCVGHTHIDVAWLWDLEQTRHKAVRTFATMLKLMDEYPEFKFMSSQAQLYDFVKQDQPELFERIREKVKRGRWEVEGGMWVEADCNLSGGEALIRQFLYGGEFFMNEFGVRSRILWLPDVFGYSAALPQILKKCGIDYFMTSKLSWSEFNKSPYDTFMWKGIDGTKVLTHFTPSREYTGEGSYERHEDLQYFTTYNAMLSPNQIKGGWQRFQQKGLDNHYLVSYGFGDGGGGSADWMIENARRMKNPVAGSPVVRQTFAREFFEQLEARVMGKRELPTWSGELYLEYHRGTYTSQGKNKRNNRKLEIELRETELWREYAFNACALEYPQAELRSIWRRMLTLQFHDILPGSSIHKVYTDSDEIYEALFKEAAALKRAALDALAARVKGDVKLFNSLSRSRDDIVSLDVPEDVSAIVSPQGDVYPVQRCSFGRAAYVKNLSAMSATGFTCARTSAAPAKVHVDERGFETPFFKGEFDSRMRITSFVDKRAGRELVKPGQALNRLVYYENRPHNYDAWDINIYYSERFWEVDELVSAEILSQGPVLSEIRATWKTGDSRVSQVMRFYADLPRVDFDTEVDWNEAQGLLKAHFPLDVFYNEAQFDIQYGNVTRATHKNTSWDVARFEVCAHKWVDVSEAGYGVSLLNDCKYGHSVDEDGVALTLIKSSTNPDPTADQHSHQFSYSIYPHEGTWREADTPYMAYRFNIPVTCVPGAADGECAELASYARVDKPNVIVECVKRALNGEGAVLRLYECFGARTNASLTLPGWVKSARYINMLECDEGEAAIQAGRIALTLKPYEILTLKLA